jgi:hypothetical protein
VGDVLLRYEDQLLIGETRAPGSTWAPALFVGAVSLALACGATLVFPDGPVGFVGAIAFAAGAAALLAAAVALDRKARRPRRFVLNFDAEMLRLEGATGPGVGFATVTVGFDAVRDLAIIPGPRGGFWLEATYEAEGARHAHVLVDRATPAEVESLRRLWRLLRAAFGLQP